MRDAQGRTHTDAGVKTGGRYDTERRAESSPDSLSRTEALDTGARTNSGTEYIDPYPGMKGADLVSVDCGRCGGTGLYSGPTSATWDRGNGSQPYCFYCGGARSRRVLVSSVRATVRRHATEAAARLVQRDADLLARENWTNAGYDELLESIEALTMQLRDNDPIHRQAEAARDRINRYAATPVDADAVHAVFAAVAERDAAKLPAPTGRVEITGTVLSTKYVENEFGGSLKMLVEGNGWKVWGSIPSGVDAERGDQVTFTATVKPSDDDASFGFFSRPAKASVVQKAAPVE